MQRKSDKFKVTFTLDSHMIWFRFYRYKCFYQREVLGRAGEI